MTCIKATFLLLPCIFFNTAALSQKYTVYAQEATGKTTVVNSDLINKRIQAIKNVDKGKVTSLERSLNSQLKILFSDPSFHPPKGFIAESSFNIESDPFLQSVSFPACSLSFDFYYIENNTKTGNQKKTMDGTHLGLETNNILHFLRQVGNYWKDCDELNLPLFFEELPISHSTTDYIELDFKRYGFPHIAPDKPFRIILRNDKPLFIPLTRREFIEFIIAKVRHKINNTRKQIMDIEKDSLEAWKLILHPDPYATEPLKKILRIRIEADRKNITVEQFTVNDMDEKLKQYNKALASMSVAEASSAVKIDYRKNVFADPLHAMVPIEKPGGTGLYKINPDYYDRSPTSSGAQIIIAYYSLPRDFGPSSLNYLEKKTVELFQHLDYHALKIRMRQPLTL